MDKRTEALRIWQEATDMLMSGDVDEAIDLFDESLALEPTAEAYTFRGWARSLREEIDEAIADCRKAIETDPTFGNAYNDIGCYLMQQGRKDEAITWLKKAKRAPRYEPRHFPCLNLGRLYSEKGMLVQALAEFEEALQLRPDDEAARAGVARLRPQIN